MRKTIAAVLVAALLWFVMFSPWTAPHINFWYTMTCAALTITTLSTIWCREWLIYSMKGGTPPAVIALLLLLVIGPAEEIFWRGFIQRRMMARWGANAGLIAATACYTLVHLPSLNFMLIVAAGVVGGCWGLIYRFFPRSLTALIISHAVWDACAFVLFPF